MMAPTRAAVGTGPPLTGGETGPTTVPLGFNINFYGTEYSGVYINNNGNITFD